MFDTEKRGQMKNLIFNFNRATPGLQNTRKGFLARSYLVFLLPGVFI